MSTYHECDYCGATYPDGSSCVCNSVESIDELRSRIDVLLEERVSIKEQLDFATKALEDALAVSKNREVFVMMGAGGWMKAARIIEAALEKLKDE